MKFRCGLWSGLTAFAVVVLFCAVSGAEDGGSVHPVTGDAVHKRVESWIPFRAVTTGPKQHWFAYYDKLQFDPSGRYLLGMEVDFNGRSPLPDDILRLGMVDTGDGDRWTELGSTRAWNWQQGCMLQWLPGESGRVIWNDRRGGRFVSIIRNVGSGAEKEVPFPVYTVSPDGRSAMSTDFRRINDMRPGYGYAGIPDPNADVLAPGDSGIRHVDLERRTADLVITYEQVAAIPWPRGDLSAGKHYFNHLLFNPDGSRFIFLHRWRNPGERGWKTRMLTAAPDGSDIRVIDDNGMTSHFIWRDDTHILAWSDQPSHGGRFYLFTDAGDPAPRVVGEDVMLRDGHCSYLPGAEWIVNDTYPDKNRLIHLYLFHAATGGVLPVANVYLPPEFAGEWRVDTHPRCSPDGRYLCIDGAFEGFGRQMYLFDVGALTEGR